MNISPRWRRWNIRLIGRGFSGEILARACNGRYNQLEVNRGLGETLPNKYCERQNNQWLLWEDIRRMVEFAQLNSIQS